MSKKTTLKLLDEVNCKFEGLDPAVRRKMVAALKFEIPGARYTPSVKMGRWDGKKSFCTTGASTYINLLDLLLPIIIEAGYDVEIDDHRLDHGIDFQNVDEHLFEGKTWAEGHPMAGEPIVLRDYQVECINKYLENPQCLQEISTGAGKCRSYDSKMTVGINEKSDFGNFLLNKVKNEYGSNKNGCTNIM